MASLTVRNVDNEIKARLRIQAAHHGRSMEEEVRDILRTALSASGDTAQDLAAAIRRRFNTCGGVELDIPSREPMREPPDFSQ
jgi:plasmid stability protein